MNKPSEMKWELIPKRKTNKYSIDEKLLAIGVLDSSRRDFDGELVPQYDKIGQMLDIPPATLHNWYARKEEIEKQVSAMIDAMPQSIVLTLSIQIRMIINELGQRIPDMSTRDLVQYFANAVTKLRLLQGRSTSNISANINYIPPK